MKITRTKGFMKAVVAVEMVLDRYGHDAELEDVIEQISLYFADKQFSREEITGPILDHAFAEFHEVLDVDSVRCALESAWKEEVSK